MSESDDLIALFVSKIISATLAEQSRRSVDIRNLKPVKKNQNEFADKIAKELEVECGAAADGVSGELNHIQNLYVDLFDLFQSMRDLIVEDVRETLKSELRMELMWEMQGAANTINDTTSSTAANTTSTSNTTSSKTPTVKTVKPKPTPVKTKFPAFKFQDDLDIEPEIEKASKKTTINTTNTINTTSGKITPLGTTISLSDSVPKTNQRSDEEVAELLKNNPLYNRIDVSLNRMKSGQSSHSVDSLIEARGDRFDVKEAQRFRLNAATFNQDKDSESSDSEEDRWDKLLETKMGL